MNDEAALDTCKEDELVHITPAFQAYDACLEAEWEPSSNRLRDVFEAQAKMVFDTRLVETAPEILTAYDAS